MIRISTLALAAGLAVGAASLAHATPDLVGKWTYKVGTTATPCTVTLSADATGGAGDVTAGEGCPGGLATPARWRTVGTKLNLLTRAGNLVAILHPKGDSYRGRQIGGGRTVVLSH